MRKKDKYILGLLIVAVLIFVPTYFFTIPTINEITDLRNTTDSLRAREDAYFEKSKLLDELHNVYLLTDEEFGDTFIRSGAVSQTFDAHLLFTGISTTNGVTIASLNMGRSVSVDLPPVAIHLLAYDADLLGWDSTTSVASIGERVSAGRMPVSLTVSGSFQNILSFVDTVNEHGFITVDSINISDTQRQPNVDANLVLSIYWIDIADWN
jgi:hypothetical protein